ncbi:MAG: DNA repair protein RecO [Nitrospiraceae bacterium]|nr:DNA repair protein RecO [Nitrospiraceae bacterium]
MLKRTEGIVLKTTPFGEADLIVTYLTYDLGLAKAFAKSPRKTKSRFGSSLEPFTYSRISFWGKENANLPKLTQSDIILPFKSIRENLSCFLQMSEAIELTLNFMPEHEQNKEVFKLLFNLLKAADNNSDIILKIILYKIQFLYLTGYAPRLDGCAVCGKSGLSFYLSHGSIICEKCASGLNSPMKLSPAAIKFYESLSRWNISLVSRLKPSQSLVTELSNMLNDHIRYTLSKPLKSRSFENIISNN